MLDTVDKLEEQLKNQSLEMTHSLREPESDKFKRISEKADAAMKRFTSKLKKELKKNGKSEQGKRQPV